MNKIGEFQIVRKEYTFVVDVFRESFESRLPKGGQMVSMIMPYFYIAKFNSNDAVDLKIEIQAKGLNVIEEFLKPMFELAVDNLYPHFKDEI